MVVLWIRKVELVLWEEECLEGKFDLIDNEDKLESNCIIDNKIV